MIEIFVTNPEDRPFDAEKTPLQRGLWYVLPPAPHVSSSMDGTMLQVCHVSQVYRRVLMAVAEESRTFTVASVWQMGLYRSQSSDALFEAAR